MNALDRYRVGTRWKKKKNQNGKFKHATWTFFDYMRCASICTIISLNHDYVRFFHFIFFLFFSNINVVKIPTHLLFMKRGWSKWLATVSQSQFFFFCCFGLYFPRLFRTYFVSQFFEIQHFTDLNWLESLPLMAIFKH